MRAHLALDGAEHGGVHLLAHEAAGEQAPDHIELKTKQTKKSARQYGPAREAGGGRRTRLRNRGGGLLFNEIQVRSCSRGEKI